MTRLALGAKCGTPGSPPITAGFVSAASACGPSNEARAATPVAAAALPKKWRRVVCARNSLSGDIGLFLRDRFVETEQHAAESRPGGELGEIQLFIAARGADADE